MWTFERFKSCSVKLTDILLPHELDEITCTECLCKSFASKVVIIAFRSPEIQKVKLVGACAPTCTSISPMLYSEASQKIDKGLDSS